MGPDGAGIGATADVPRGDVTVGQLTDLDPLRAEAVRLARLWQSGDAGRDQTTIEIAERLAPAAAVCAVEALGSIWVLLAWVGRRRLMLRAPEDAALSADEALLAALVDTAAGGAQDDAMLFASLMVRAEAAGDLTEAAAVFGQALLQMAGRAAPAEPVEASAERPA